MRINLRISAVMAMFLIGAASCSRQAITEGSVCGYVSGILEDKYSPENMLLQGLRNPGSSADIAIVGSRHCCDSLSSLMLRLDLHENVDGSCKQDGLPDFAGENLVSIVDRSIPSWRSSIEQGDTSLVRELAVRRALAAIDTTFNISTYDLEGNGIKKSSKIIIMADAWFSRYGVSDVRVLLNATGSRVQVLNPVEVMYDELFSKAAKKLNVGIICDSLYLGSGIYEDGFLERAHSAGIANCDCFCATVSSREMPLIQFLESYYSSGRILPLDAILIDDCKVDMEAIYSNLKDLQDFSLPESTSYIKLLGTDVLLMQSSAKVAEECYHILRASNSFTHRIAYPSARTFETGYRPAMAEHPFMTTPANVQN